MNTSRAGTITTQHENAAEIFGETDYRSADLSGDNMNGQGEELYQQERHSHDEGEECEASSEDEDKDSGEEVGDEEETEEDEEGEYNLEKYHQQSDLPNNGESWVDCRDGASEESEDESEQSSLVEEEKEEAGDGERFGEVSFQRPLQLDHVDFILDSIDAELSDIINRSEHDNKHVSNKKKTLRQGVQHQATEEGALDTGLGTGSPEDSREASPKPPHQKRTMQLKKKGKRQKKPASDWSDTESIASIDVRSRVQEVLVKHGMDHNLRNSSSVSGSESQTGDVPETEIEDEENITLKSPKSERSHLSNSVSRKRVKKKSRNKKQGLEMEEMSHDSDNYSSVTLNDEYANEPSDMGSDLESIATEDFESKFQQYVRSPVSTNLPRRDDAVESMKASVGQPPSRDSTIDLRRRALSQSIIPRHSFVKTTKKAAPPPQRKSGLPEYMYLKKEVTESDVGSDSIWTEDYEAQYWKAGRPQQKGLPVARTLKTSNILDSDKESVQTEEYESYFNHLMVKQLAGVPVRYYDEVTIASDLDSFQTTEVQEKVQQVRSGGKPNLDPKVRKGRRNTRQKKVLTSTPYQPKSTPFTKGKHMAIGRQNLLQEFNS